MYNKSSLFILVFAMACTVNVSLAAEETSSTEFIYTIKNPRDINAQKYIISKSNIEIQDEPPVTYWLPSSGGETMSSTTPGVIIYHFPLTRPIATATLLANLATFHWSYSEGHDFLFVSTDGNNWIKAAELEAPEFGEARGNSTVTLPPVFTGQKNIYVKIELYSYGSKASQGPPWTNTAQHLRYDHNHDSTTFELDVQLSSSEAMDVPTDNRFFNYSPRVSPVISSDPETAFPMGLGSAVEKGDLLDLLIDANSFKEPVNLYLGILAPAINPNEIYLFDEAGDLQGMSMSGLVPWKSNITESVSATPIADLPTALLPSGTYTFYFAVAPAGNQDNFWLWQTEFKHVSLGAKLKDMYDQNPEAFTFCQSLAYAEITGHAKENVQKAEVAQAFVDNGYSKVNEGYIAETSTDRYVDIQEGDIIMFGFDSAPHADNASHYAVVHGNRVWQVVYWGKDGKGNEISSFDGPREIEWFFQKRVLINPETGEEVTSHRIYQYYVIYNKKM